MATNYDVIIIGSGAGGGTLARHLAPSGKSILILERGDWLPREQENWDAEEVFIKNRYVPKETWYDKNGKAFQPGLHYWVGGATKLYGAALYRLRKEDFGELKHHDGISPAWPISYDEMEPYYTKAEQIYQVHGAHGEDPTEGPASAPYPLPGGLARAAHPEARRRSGEGGLSSFPCALRHHAQRAKQAVQRLHSLQGLRRLPVSRACQIGCRGVGRAPGAAISECHADDQCQGGQAQHQLRRARRSPKWSSNATVRTETYQGGIVVVSAGAANSAKLLLLSANDKHPNGLGERLRSSRPQLHVSQQRGRAGDLQGTEPDRVPEDPGA